MKNWRSISLSRRFPKLGVMAALSMAATAWASNVGTSSGPSGSTSSAYIEHPQSSVTVTNTYSGGYYGGPVYSGSYYSGGYWSGGYSGSVRTYEPRRYFFPPNPPALGEPYPRNRTKSAGLVRSTIPLTLSEYVNEPFYSPLSPFLFDESLSKRRQKMLDDYMATKRALIAELRAKIAGVEHADPTTREAQLAEFAREQTPRIVTLEATAYSIRDEFTRWHLFSETADWNEGRSWRLGDDTRWESTLDELKAIRGSAFFQDGLSPAQRRLLRELAMELEDAGAGPGSEIRLDVRGPFFYFSPETSRIRLPSNLPPELAEKIARYTREKAEMKKELRDVLYREDRRWFDSHRSAAFRELGERQAPRFAELETLAEEIRRGLAPLPNPARPPTPAQALPPELATRTAAFMDAKSTFEQTMNRELVDLKKQFPTSRVEFVKVEGGYAIQIVPNRKLNTEDSARVAAAQAQLVSFNDEQSKAYRHLVVEKDAIRDGLVKSAGTLAPMVTARIVDLILRDYANTLAVQELWRQYHDYEVAVLQPGLSPEQRRLLYDAALVKLDQQLPHYTY